MKLHPNGLVLRDELGRQRIFRGENICFKNPDFSPSFIKNFLNTRFNKLHKAGTNLVRLGTTWASIEGREGVYNEEIISIFHDFVKKCEKTGVYVYLDMHQDLYSRVFYGDGMPKWAVDSSIKPKHFMAIWAEGYFYMDSVQQGFYDFWHNKNNVQDKFIKAWAHFARAFDDCENVIGYDYLNEPYIERDGRRLFTTFLENIVEEMYGQRLDLLSNFENCEDKKGFIKVIKDIARVVVANGGAFDMLERMDSYDKFANAVDGLEIYTKEFNENFYQPFIERCDKEINKDRLSLFEHNYFSNMGVPFEIATKENYIYSPHAYDLFVDSPLYNKYSSNDRIKFITDQIRENQLKMNVPVIFGEWGCGAQGNEWINHIEYVMDIMEQNQWSNTYWSYRHENSEFCKRINRPYPVAICGDIIEYKTDSKARSFRLVFEQKDGFDEIDNIIYIPKKGYHRFKAMVGKNIVNITY